MEQLQSMSGGTGMAEEAKKALDVLRKKKAHVDQMHKKKILQGNLNLIKLLSKFGYVTSKFSQIFSQCSKKCITYQDLCKNSSVNLANRVLNFLVNQA